MPRRVWAAAGIVVLAPVIQLLVERAVTLPVGPSRMITIGVWLFAWGPIAIFALDRIGAAPSGTRARRAIGLLVPAFGLAHLLGIARLLDGPFGPIPGGPLRGPVATSPQPDWSSARDLRYAELEVQPVRPRSLETLVLVKDQSLYVAANMPASKRWPAEVRADARVRVRVGAEVHERAARMIVDDAEADALLLAMNEKYGFDVSLGGEIWFFQLESR